MNRQWQAGWRPRFAALRRADVHHLLVAASIVAAVALTQLAAGSYHNDLATYPDEAAHFVTAMCVVDYVTTAFGTNPIAFAEAYYAHYPKVAFGHWPPAFFLFQAAWYTVFGASVPISMLLIALFACAAAIVLYLRLRQFFGASIAILALVVYMTMPAVQRSSSMLMPDMAAALFGLLAVLTFCDGCVERTWRPWLASALWAAAAVLTKESALTVLLYGAMAFILLAGNVRRQSRLTWYFWPSLALLIVGLLAAYQVSGVLRVRGLPNTMYLPPLRERVRFLGLFLQMAPWPVFVTAALGVIETVFPRSEADRRVAVYLRGALLWLSIWLAGQVVFRDGVEQRYFLPAVFPVILLFAAGLKSIATRIEAGLTRVVEQTTWSMVAARTVVPIALAAMSVGLMGSPGMRHRSGYQRVMASIPDVESGSTILVSSDPSGEGAMIAEALLRNVPRNAVVLRGSKTLGDSDWIGGHYRPLAMTTQDVVRILDDIPVRFVVLDTNGFIDEGERTEHRLLEQTLRGAPDRFQLIADLPLSFDDRPHEGMIQVYENVSARDRRPVQIRLPMAASLGRRLDVNVTEWNGTTRRWASALQRGSALGDRIRQIADVFGSPLQQRSASIASIRLRPSRDILDAAGGPGKIAITASDHREWPIHSTVPWVTITGRDSGSGDGLLRYEIARNESNSRRTGAIIVGNVQYSVAQGPAR